VKATSLIKILWRPWILIIPLLSCLGTSSWGDTNDAAPGSHRVSNSEGHRFLVVLEASKAMQREGEAAVAAIDELLKTGMQGQCRHGDTLGVWTYNDQLYAGRLPLQHWSSEDRQQIRKQILEFISQQKCEKTGNLSKIMPTLFQVVKDSDLISVIIVSTGEEEITGTPFDGQINAYFRTWRERQRKDAKPFVTVLRGERGNLTAYSVCPMPWPVNLPPLPQDRNPVPVAQAKPAPAKPAVVRSAKPLIVTGSSKSVDSTTASQAVPAPVPTAVPEARTGYVIQDHRQRTAEQIVSNLLAEAGVPTASTQKVQVIASSPAEAHPSPGMNSAVTNATNVPLIAASVTHKFQAEDPPAHPAPVATPASAPPTPAVTVAATSAPPAKVAEPTIAAKSEAVKPTPEPAPVKQAPSSPSVAPVPAPSSLAVPQQTGTDEKPAGFLARKETQWLLLALAVVALAVLVVSMRRPKQTYQPSIITRSLERGSR
jgi:hypothetical protein